MSLRFWCLALLVIGLALNLPFEAWYTRLPGVLALVGFIVTGLFLVATPAYLDAHDDHTEGPASRSAGLRRTQ